ncbi:MAG: S8 family serine peptidase [Bdellovibrionaceae bacterium]|jgi:hypothetical protein|nr:S8 family serine peptidase [Pseudobdellovibrionaceae bacterium]
MRSDKYFVKSYFIILLGLVVLPVLFNACEGEFKASQSFGSLDLHSTLYTQLVCPEEIAISQKTMQNNDVFATRKVQLFSQETGTSEKLNFQELEIGTELSAKVSNICIAKGDFDESLFLSPSITLSDYQYIYFKLDKTMTLKSFEAEVNANPCIVGVGKSHRYKSQALQVQDQHIGEQLSYLRAIKADGVFRLMGEENFPSLDLDEKVIVAVIDTGVDFTHEDLKENIWFDAEGVAGFNAIYQEDISDTMDEDYHGTHVAGIIAAQNNQLGIVGISPTNTLIMPIRVLAGENRGGRSFELASGIRYAVENGAHIINMSLGSVGSASDTDAVVKDAIQDAIRNGVFVVTSVGNITSTDQILDREISKTGYHLMPSIYSTEFDGMVSVGSFDSETGDFSYFSLYSPTLLEISAPGAINQDIHVYSTVPYINTKDNHQSYTYSYGTSMAAPMVAAGAAILKSVAKQKSKTLDPALVEWYILNSSDSDGHIFDYVENGRKLNVNRLYQMAHKCL